MVLMMLPNVLSLEQDFVDDLRYLE
jgi:hypothetical protein